MKNFPRILLVITVLMTAITTRADTLFVPNALTNHVMQFASPGDGSVFANTSLGTWGVAFDAAGNVYVSTPGDNSIHKFSSTGTDLGVFATLGTAVGWGPMGLAFDRAGNLYASDPSDDTIKKFTPGGSGSIFVPGGSLSYPIGLAFDTASNLYVANGNGNSIAKFSPTGTYLGVYANSGGGSPYGIAFDSSGNLYVANNTVGGIAKITTNGAVSTFANIGANPIGVAVDSAGNVYGAYNQPNYIRKFSSTGTDLGIFATNGLNSPMMIAFKTDSTPALSIASSGNQSVLFWPASGTNYILQSTTNLASTNWVNATDAVPVIAFTVTNTSPARFFRLVQP